MTLVTPFLRRLACLGLMLLPASPVLAQAWPNKPIRIVVGFPPGGGNDIIARLAGAKMQETWGQSVVIENRPGANSIIAAEFVAKAAPDGYTLLVNATGGMTVNPSLYPKLSYDPIRDFVPISIIGSFPMVLAVHPSVPATTVQELVAHARANPGKLNYSSGSTSFQLATELLKQMTGISMNHVPYKGSAASANAVLANDVQVTIIDAPPVLPQIRGGRLRGLAVTSAKRVSAAPELPTIAESGVPGYDMSLWIALFAPAGTPQDVSARLSAEAMRIAQLPDVREKLLGLGVEPVGSTQEQLAATLRAEIPRYGAVIKASGMKAD
jgi:tripartite-type tricarboxylate transporter receptor subunit TctC